MDDLIIETTGTVLKLLGIPFTGILVKKDGEMIRVEVISDQASRLIGWHGETLNAVQHLVKSMIRTAKNLERAPFIVVDVDGYRTMQEEKVRKIAEAKADFVRRTGARVTLPPMSPYFRRVVHTHISATPTLSDLATESIGEGDYRQVVIRLKSGKQASEPNSEVSEELSPVMATDDGLENLDV
jgi:spoIIIJ-associated protein